MGKYLTLAKSVQLQHGTNLSRHADISPTDAAQVPQTEQTDKALTGSVGRAQAVRGAIESDYPLTLPERLLRDSLQRIEENAADQSAEVTERIGDLVAQQARKLDGLFIAGDVTRVVAELCVLERAVALITRERTW